MSLGTTISRLRAEKKLSQGDLADALGVSRQSVSKWETDTSVPELDKLVKLSQLFGITLDELVTGEAPPESAPVSPPPFPPRQIPGRKIAAIVLLCMAFLVWLALTALGGPLECLILAAPFMVCAAICFTVKRRTGLWCAWTLYGIADIFLYFSTSLRWRLLFRPAVYEYYSGLHFILAFVQIGIMAALVIGTMILFRKSVKIPGKKQLLAGWILWVALQFISVPTPSRGMAVNLYLLLSALLDFAGLALFAALLTATFCALRKPKS